MIVLGRIVAPFGVKGWVRVVPYGDDPLEWGAMAHWWVAANPDSPDDTWKPFALSECRAHGDGLIASFEGVADRNAAEQLKGWYVGAAREALPDPAENEYYWHDLVGMQVESLEGEALGTVEGLISTGAHDVLRVLDGEAERLIPFVAAYAVEVDLDRQRIRVDWQKDW